MSSRAVGHRMWGGVTTGYITPDGRLKVSCRCGKIVAMVDAEKVRAGDLPEFACPCEREAAPCR